MGAPSLSNPHPDTEVKMPSVLPAMHVLKNTTAYIPLPFHNTYRRVRMNYQNIKYEHIYKTCSGNTTIDCGFWMNVENNKTVPAGRTTFDLKLGKLVVENVRQHDAGMYMTGDRSTVIMVFADNGL
ncbi:hypothetical protein CRE_28861 [Caenorhabditis remanei]|uniref:Uncharacterized protein n=1 Tax=Caenorhabditis remanei TaxID=31234 RepID=E3MXI1_CAERE|nr:hypothetical protein CRE_28861 [Caenorhabditis remanei]